LKPQLAALAKKHGDKVVVLLVNVNSEGPLAMKANVRSIPDSRLFSGGKQVANVVGGRSMDFFEALVLKHAKSLPPPVLAQTGARAASANGKTPAEQPKIVPLKDYTLPPGVTRVK
jgi:thioredoxin-like negative regulator of GroEL